MSKRVILSIIIIVLAAGLILIQRGMIAGLAGAFLFVVLLLLWAIPSNPNDNNKRFKRPDWKPLTVSFLGIGLGLFASIAAALILPPRVFPWVIIAAGIGLIIWFFVSRR